MAEQRTFTLDEINQILQAEYQRWKATDDAIIEESGTLLTFGTVSGAIGAVSNLISAFNFPEAFAAGLSLKNTVEP